MRTLHRHLFPALLLLLITGCTDGLLVESAAPAQTGEAVAPAQRQAPIRISFDKSASGEGTWAGTVGGDLSGTLQTVLQEARGSGPVLHVVFDWIVSAGAHSFTARLSGILNTNTGQVVMNGTVVSGWLLGAQVHEEGQLIDPSTGRFQGSLRLMPATAP